MSYGFSEGDWSQELRDAAMDVGGVASSESRFRWVVANALVSIARSLEEISAQGKEE